MFQSMNLQLFADGGAGAGAAGTGDAGNSGVTQQAAAAGTGVEPQAAAVEYKHRTGRRANPLANVQYGKQPDAAAQQQPEAPASEKAQAEPQDDAASWKELKSGKYKEHFDRDVQTIVQGRLRDAQANQDKLDKLAPMLEALAKQKGVDVKDVDGLIAKVLDADSLYEEESMRTGTPVETLKMLHKLERERDDAQNTASRFAEEERNRRHILGLIEQAQALTAKYPSFDLRTEMQNERFKAMTSPSGGLSVEEAYFALHHRELTQSAMQQAATQAQQQTMQTVQANRARPVENGAKGAGRAVEVRSDPSTLKMKDLREISRRVAAGEKISF